MNKTKGLHLDFPLCACVDDCRTKGRPGTYLELTAAVNSSAVMGFENRVKVPSVAAVCPSGLVAAMQSFKVTTLKPFSHAVRIVDSQQQFWCGVVHQRSRWRRSSSEAVISKTATHKDHVSHRQESSDDHGLDFMLLEFSLKVGTREGICTHMAGAVGSSGAVRLWGREVLPPDRVRVCMPSSPVSSWPVFAVPLVVWVVVKKLRWVISSSAPRWWGSGGGVAPAGREWAV